MGRQSKHTHPLIGAAAFAEANSPQNRSAKTNVPSRLDNVSATRYMVSARKVPSRATPAPVLGEVARFPVQPKVQSATDEASSRMGDEGCPNESPSVEDVTGYSRERRKLMQ